jgi:hypothetical protein
VGLITLAAQAYCNHGRWVADCPRQYCGNAVALEPKQSTFHCAAPVGGCQLLAEVEWPPNIDEIQEALQQRPVPGTRNWAPAGHWQAIACHVPKGQTVADLIAENNEYGRL